MHILYNSGLTLSGYIPSEIADFLINGLGLNSGIKIMKFINVNFSKASLKSWTFCFALNNSIQNINSNIYL